MKPQVCWASSSRRAHLRHAHPGLAHAHRLHRGDGLAGEQVEGVDHPQRERRVVSGGLADRLVSVEDREAGLQRVVVDLAAQLRDGQAEHVVVVDHQPLQEQVADLLDAEGRGLRLVPALGHVRAQEGQGGLLVALVLEDRLADAHRDRQDHDAVLADEFGRQVAGRVDDDSDAHAPSRGTRHVECAKPIAKMPRQRVPAVMLSCGG